jgi:hypothetical protein
MADEDLSTNSTQEPKVVPSGNIMLQAQIKALQDALTKRMNPMFDPTLMALSAGFLKPTKTGGFGESFGYALEGAAGAQEQERSRKSEMEKLQLELALKEYEMKQSEEGKKMLAQFMSPSEEPQTKLTKDATAAPVSAGKETPSAVGEAPQVATKDVNEDVAVKLVGKDPRLLNKITLTPKIALALSQAYPSMSKQIENAVNNQRDMYKLAQEDVKISQEDIKIAQSRYKPDTVGIFDTQTGQYTSKNPQGSEKVADPVDPTNKEGILVPRDLIPELNKLRGRPREEIINFLRFNNIPTIYTVGTEKPLAKDEGKTGPTIIPLPQSAEERALVVKQRESELSGTGPVVDAINNLNSNALNAGTMISSSKEAIDLAKSNPNAFKQLMNSDVRNAIDKIKAAAVEGIQIPFGSLALPPDTIRKLNLSTGDIMALQKFAQIEALQTLMARKAWLTGQGAVANAESKLAESIGPQSSDRPEVIRMKAEAVIEKARFNEAAAEAYGRFTDNNPVTGTWNRFLNSREFKDVEKAYVEKLERMSKANAAFLSGKPVEKSTSNKPSNTPSSRAPKPGSVYQRIEEEQRRLNEGKQSD